MIQWKISPMPDGHCALAIQDSRTGEGFVMIFSSVGKLTETLDQIAGQAEGMVCQSCSFEGMSAFVEAFPERF